MSTFEFIITVIVLSVGGGIAYAVIVDSRVWKDYKLRMYQREGEWKQHQRMEQREKDYRANFGENDPTSDILKTYVLPEALAPHLSAAADNIRTRLGIISPTVPEPGTAPGWGVTARIYAEPFPYIDLIHAVCRAALAQYPKDVAGIALAGKWDINRFNGDILPAISEISKQYQVPIALPNEATAEAYKIPFTFSGTVFAPLDNVPPPQVIPPLKWFEHAWIAAPPGAGKSTVLTYLISERLKEVERNEASIIVMESKRDLFEGLTNLADFAPEGRLHGRLVSIDLEDVEHPPSINLFDLGDRTHLSARDREVFYNAAISNLEYVFRSLLKMDLTGRQGTLFGFTVELLFEIEGASLETMRELMMEGGLRKYQTSLSKLRPAARTFFETTFTGKDDRFIKSTKEEIVARIDAVLRYKTLGAILSATTTRLNLYDQLASAKVIAISYPKGLFQEDGVELIGRFFISQILIAAQRRQFVDRDKRLPTYLFIDECHDVIRNDTQISTFLDQARSLNVGLVLAHQRLDQLSAPVLNALYGSTSIKMAAHLHDANASALARNMGTTPDFIRDVPPYVFAAYVRGLTKEATTFSVPPVDFAKMPRMSKPEANALRREMRERFSMGAGEEEAGEPEPRKPAKRPVTEKESSEW